MTMILRYEVNDLAPKIPGGSSPVITKRLFNAALALIDGPGTARPYLAEALPELNTASWRLFPDGRMETTYRLRPGLTWQDGRPLTSDDFVFAYRAYTATGLAIFIPTPQDQIEAVLAPDPRTVVIRWRSPYPDANALKDSELDPLPRHILEQPFAAYEEDPSTRDLLINHPYWTTEYVGAGPYRLEPWEQSSLIEGTAFDAHALGRPKIDRLVLRIIGDENTVLSNVLSDNVDFTADFTLRFEHARVLQGDWARSGKGVVMLKPGGVVSNSIQLRPEYVAHPAQLDVRARRAMAHAIDRDALNQGVFDGEGIVIENPVPRGVSYFEDADRAIEHHRYDPRRSEQLMAEAGFAKDRDGFFASAVGDRFRTDFRAIAGPEFERGQAIMVDTWRRVGFDVSSSVLPANLVRDAEARHTFAGMATRGGGNSERMWTTAEIATAATRWVGDNRAGWSPPGYDALFDAFSNTLDRAERTRLAIQMHRVASEHLPMFVLYHALQVNTHRVALRGPEAGIPGSGTLTPGTLAHWNVHEWEFTSR